MARASLLLVAALAALSVVAAWSEVAELQAPMSSCSGCSSISVGGATFDMSGACAAAGYTLQWKDFTYTAQICGNAPGECLPPTWKTQHNTGVAIQYVGSSTPSCNPPGCVDPSTGTKICCTKACHVLGTGAPQWSLKDPSNPQTGGLVAKFAPVAVDINNDPFWCPPLPDGSMEPRSVTYNITCDPSVAGAVVNSVSAAKMDNYCTVTLDFSSSLACAK